jgi:hypothetical protein
VDLREGLFWDGRAHGGIASGPYVVSYCIGPAGQAGGMGYKCVRTLYTPAPLPR